MSLYTDKSDCSKMNLKSDINDLNTSLSSISK